MKIIHHVKTAYTGISTNKSRSLLTILGIVIGIASIMIVMSLGQGAQSLILGQIEGMGSNIVTVQSGKKTNNPSDAMGRIMDALKEKDVNALRRPANVQGIKDITPTVFLPTTVNYEGEKISTGIFGASEMVLDILREYPEQGSFFTAEDIRQKSRVAVLGWEVYEDLFGRSDAIGQTIRIKGQPFRVIGIFPNTNKASFFSTKSMIIVPYSSAQQYLTGQDYFTEIIIQVEEGFSMDRVVADIEATMLESHGIDRMDDADFHVVTQKEIVDSISTVTDILTWLLASVAAISLLVGGIGIMNIMLVSVTERTREIGLRKALGATEGTILYQFLFESIILTAIGGVIGIILGGAFSFLVSIFLSNVMNLDWKFEFPIFAAFLGLSVSALIGLVFGLYPARNAARKSPMEALRSE